jgi:hypothetical protein
MPHPGVDDISCNRPAIDQAFAAMDRTGGRGRPRLWSDLPHSWLPPPDSWTDLPGLCGHRPRIGRAGLGSARSRRRSGGDGPELARSVSTPGKRATGLGMQSTGLVSRPTALGRKGTGHLPRFTSPVERWTSPGERWTSPGERWTSPGRGGIGPGRGGIAPGWGGLALDGVGCKPRFPVDRAPVPCGSLSDRASCRVRATKSLWGGRGEHVR